MCLDPGAKNCVCISYILASIVSIKLNATKKVKCNKKSGGTWPAPVGLSINGVGLHWIQPNPPSQSLQLFLSFLSFFSVFFPFFSIFVVQSNYKVTTK